MAVGGMVLYPYRLQWVSMVSAAAVVAPGREQTRSRFVLVMACLYRLTPPDVFSLKRFAEQSATIMPSSIE